MTLGLSERSRAAGVVSCFLLIVIYRERPVHALGTLKCACAVQAALPGLVCVEQDCDGLCAWLASSSARDGKRVAGWHAGCAVVSHGVAPGLRAGFPCPAPGHASRADAWYVSAATVLCGRQADCKPRLDGMVLLEGD